MHDLRTIKRLNDEAVDGLDVRPRGRFAKPEYDLPGYALAMRVLQSGLYADLDYHERAQCNALIAEGQGRIELKPGGWVEYPRALKANGATFDEHLDTIVALIGTEQYEYKIENKVYIRRVQD